MKKIFITKLQLAGDFVQIIYHCHHEQNFHICDKKIFNISILLFVILNKYRAVDNTSISRLMTNLNTQGDIGIIISRVRTHFVAETIFFQHYFKNDSHQNLRSNCTCTLQNKTFMLNGMFQ